MKRVIRTLLLGVLTGMALLAWRREVVHLPPWQDQAVGLWAEADYLAETHFDYWRLRYQEPHYLDVPSGRRSYMISALPTLLAMLMLALPDISDVIKVVHVTSFLVAGVTLALLFTLLRPVVGWMMGLLLAIALATTPVFITQIELAGMDVALGLPVLIALALLGYGSYTGAAMVSGIAFLMKASGQLVTFAGFAYLILLVLSGAGRIDDCEKRRQRRGVAVFAIVLLAEFLLILWGDTSIKQRANPAWPASLRWPGAMWTTAPDVLLLLLGGAIATALIWGTEFVRNRRANRLQLDDAATPARAETAAIRSWAGRVCAMHWFLFRDPWLLTGWILIAAFCASCWFYIFLPRYVYSMLPPLFLIWSWILCRTLCGSGRGARVAVGTAIGCLIAFNLYDSSGALLPDLDRAAAFDYSVIPSYTRRSCMLLERSREYLQDHRATIAAVDWLSRNAGNRPLLVAPHHYFLVTRPRLGYVRRPLVAYDADTFSHAIATYRDLMLARPEHPPFLVGFGKTRITLPPPRGKILYQDGDTPPLVVYVARPPQSALKNPRALEDWYLDSTWDHTWGHARLEERIPFLTSTGRYDRAVAEAEQVVAWEPNDLSLLALQAELLSRRPTGL